MQRGNTIGSRLEGLRKRDGLTQAEVAQLLSVKRETVVQWESNTRDLKTIATIKLAKLYGVTSDYILGLTSVTARNLSTQSISNTTGLSEQSIEQLKIYKSGIDDEKIYNPIDFINALLQEVRLVSALPIMCLLYNDILQKSAEEVDDSLFGNRGK